MYVFGSNVVEFSKVFTYSNLEFAISMHRVRFRKSAGHEGWRLEAESVPRLIVSTNRMLITTGHKANYYSPFICFCFNLQIIATPGVPSHADATD